ncbi:hypothetical protein [Natrinema sp. 1APR25-10V2]|uniref:hypothetical protein n=1 Tax=Natrinema sp. 1APR25-10V2 TaxID=2951081 RepID=UPI002876AA5E|nr:hypothetical protein [Natrinema sp. 1APR25-10V2]MDS0477990.1 hypothetical protein [Natrinema sp. 1APR25-10V2]
MNRRTVLRSAGVAATVSLSGCVEALQEHYQGSFRGLVPVELYNEADQHYDLRLEAYAADGDRQTYEESYTVTSGQRATAPHLDAAEQHFRATKFGEGSEPLAVKDGTITPNTSLVLVRVTNDDLILEIKRGDDNETGPTAGQESSGAETGGSDANDIA